MSEHPVKKIPHSTDYYRLSLAIEQIGQWRFHNSPRLQVFFAVSLGYLMIAAIINLSWMFRDVGLLITFAAMLITLYWIIVQVRISQAKASAERTLTRFRKQFGQAPLAKFLNETGYRQTGDEPQHLMDTTQFAKKIYHYMIRKNHYREARLIDQLNLKHSHIWSVDGFIKANHVPVDIDHEFVRQQEIKQRAEIARQKIQSQKQK